MRYVLAVIVLLLFSVPAQAQSAINCPTYNTTEFTTGGSMVLSNCTINTGPFGTIFVVATGEVTCGALSDAEINLVAGVGAAPYTNSGANFNGQIAGGVLTVNSLITPSSFKIGTGQTLFDANSGSQIPLGSTTCSGSPCKGSTVTITGLISGTGGTGTYSVSDNSITVAAESMWALNVTAPLEKPPSSLQVARDPLEHLKCQDGTTSVVSIAGTIPVDSFNQPNLLVWVALQLTSESIAGGDPQVATWNNGQISAFAIAVPRGLVQ